MLLTSPKGTVLWAALARPDHWNNYTLKLSVPTTEAYALGDRIEAEIDKVLTTEARRSVTSGDLKLANLPYRLQPNGETSFNFKVRAIRLGESQQPTVVDPEGQHMSQDRLVSADWPGALARVQFELSPFYTPVAGAGCTLRLRVVYVESFVVLPWEVHRSRPVASLSR